MTQKNLRQARDEDDLESFIKEHEEDAPGDLDKVDDVIRRVAPKEEGRKPKPAPKGKKTES